MSVEVLATKFVLNSIMLTYYYSPLLFFPIHSVGVYKGGRVEIIANDQGNRITPSYVAFTPEGERLIGDAAKNQLTTNPENTVFDAKRLIGRTWDDSSVQSDIKHFPFTTRNKNNKPHIEVQVKGEQKLFAAEEISAMVLIKMKVSPSPTRTLPLPSPSPLLSPSFPPFTFSSQLWSFCVVDS